MRMDCRRWVVNDENGLPSMGPRSSMGRRWMLLASYRGNSYFFFCKSCRVRDPTLQGWYINADGGKITTDSDWSDSDDDEGGQMSKSEHNRRAAVGAMGDRWCQPCEQYIAEVVRSVRMRLCAFLKRQPAVGGIPLFKGTSLEQQEPSKIDDIKGGLQTTKEHWRWENCRMSLEKKAMYEAPGNLFWLSTDKPTWDGEVLPATGLTYGNLSAGRQMWSDEKLLRSSHDESKQQYFVSGLIPTAVKSMVEVPAKPEVGFLKLPCLGSRAVLCGWYSTVDDALRAQDERKVLKLYEAALSMPIRMRCGPSRKQLILDSMTYSEDLFAANFTTSDSFFDFAQKVNDVFPSEPAFSNLTNGMIPPAFAMAT